MITPPSDEYLSVIRNVHESQVRLSLYEETAGGPVLVGILPQVSVSMSYDGRSYVHRSADIEYGVDPWETVSRDTIERVSTESGLITVEHGVSAAGGAEVTWVTIATLRVDSVSSAMAAASRSVRAYDRSMLVQEHLLETPRPLDGTYISLIETMLNETLGEAITITPDFDAADLALAPSEGKSLSRGAARLEEMQKLADMVDGVIYNDQYGEFVLRKTFNSGAPVWSVDTGAEGVLVGGAETTSRREQYNAVGITWNPDDTVEDTDLTVFIFLWDDDPTSPTYYDGPFGKRPIFFEEEYTHIPSNDAAEALAREKLADYTGQSRSLEVTAVYNPLLEPGDIIEVEFPSDVEGQSEVETHIVDSLVLELGPSARMSITTRLDRPSTVAGYITGSTGNVLRRIDN